MKINPKKYAQLLFEITKDKNSKDIEIEIKKFIKLLVQKNQLKNSTKIIKYFEEIYEKENSIIKAEIETANPINKDVLSHIENFITKKTGAKKIEITNKINKNLISGAVIKYGNRIIDNSLKTKINNLKIAINK